METQKKSLFRYSGFKAGCITALLGVSIFSYACSGSPSGPSQTVGQAPTPLPSISISTQSAPAAPTPVPTPEPAPVPTARPSAEPAPAAQDSWALILVNPSNLLPDDFKVELADFEGGQVDARIFEIASRMFADAKKEGVTLQLVDAYRSYSRQSELYQQKVESYIAKGLSRKEAEIEAATITARPNTSEHQTGLALDIVTPSYTSRDSGFADTRAFAWLNENAQDYGFILRYLKDKESVTKVIYEPWHWRYAGVRAARDMKGSGQSLEEYLGQTD